MKILRVLRVGLTIAECTQFIRNPSHNFWKCKVYINALDSNNLSKITVGNVKVQYADSVKYLGISLTNTLS